MVLVAIRITMGVGFWLAGIWLFFGVIWFFFVYIILTVFLVFVLFILGSFNWFDIQNRTIGVWYLSGNIADIIFIPGQNRRLLLWFLSDVLATIVICFLFLKRIIRVSDLSVDDGWSSWQPSGGFWVILVIDLLNTPI